MAEGIPGPPNEYGYGLEFNYSLWTAGTEVTLFNVPWNNDYRDIWAPDDNAAIDTYLNSIEGSALKINNLSYVKPNEPIRLDLPFNVVNRYNYLRANNPSQPINGNDFVKKYYYFITDVRYIAPNTTEVVLQLDVWITFGLDVKFGNCYIDRGHIGIANEDNFDNFGRDYLTIPEGLDVGNEYQVITKRTQKIMRIDGEGGVDVNENAILVASTVDLTSDPGTVANPKLDSASGSLFQIMPSGASYYLFNGAGNFMGFMSANRETPWMTQGIISITMIPDIRRYSPSFTYTPGSTPTDAPISILRNLSHSMFNGWRDNPEIINKIPEKYRHLKKFMTYPYMAIELTTFTATPIIIKPESWNDNNATIIERPALIPPNQRISFHPYKYNALTGSNTDPLHDTVAPGNPNVGGDDNGEYIDFATMIANFPTMAIVNNGAISYMASNANSIAFARQSADWSQTRALRSNEVAYDQATSGMNLANDLTGIGIRTDAAQTNLDVLTQAQQGMIGGGANIVSSTVNNGVQGLGSSAAQFLADGARFAVGANAAGQSFAIRAAQANNANRAQVGNAGFIRDTNKNLADWAARGDYENTIAGINARVQDANMIQPTTSGQVGGEAMNIVNNNFGFSLRWKLIDNAAIKRIGDYWLRYGYAVRVFSNITTLKVMTKFSYWRLAETYIISAPMPESFKQAIRGIFEKGVTVWSHPRDIGNIDISDNEPIPGIRI